MPKPKKVAAPKSENQSVRTEVKIPPLSLETAKLTLVGDTPLLVNRFDEKSKVQIEEGKKSKTPKEKRQFDKPEDQFLRSLYPMGKRGGKPIYGIPVSGIKNTAASATRYVEGLNSVFVKGSFHIMEDNLVEIQGSEPRMDSRFVKVGPFGNKKPSPRYRGIFDKWKVTFTIKYNKSVISLDQIVHLFENAGFSIGLCEYRPEKGGNLGMFHVARSN